MLARAALQAEILALRQLLVLQRSTQGRRVRFRVVDRVFWVWLSRLWPGWRSRVRIMKADTIIAWNRKGFRLYWTWKKVDGLKDVLLSLAKFEVSYEQ